MIELIAARTEADFNVGQTLAISNLSERHGEELIPAREAMRSVVAMIASDTTPELFRMNPRHELSKYRCFCRHPEDFGGSPAERKRKFSIISLTVLYLPIPLKTNSFQRVPKKLTG